MLKIIIAALCFIFSSDLSIKVFAQNASETFGKNKIQFTDDQKDWWIYETSNVVYYWYGKSKNVAHYVIKISEAEVQAAQTLFEYHLKDKIEIFVYADPSDLAQSNLELQANAIRNEDDNFPITQNQKILVSFTGRHDDLHKQIKKGITQVFFNSMFSGTSLQEVVQKIISYKLPEWFELGLIEYVSEGWIKNDEYELNKHLREQKISFKKFSHRFPKLAGKSFWFFITNTFGEKAISNWLYMTRIHKDLNKASRLVFGLSFTELQKEWGLYFFDPTQETKNQQTLLKKFKLKPGEKIVRVYYNESLEKNIISTNQFGKTRLRTWTPDQKRNPIIFKKGSSSKVFTSSTTYPLYAALPNNHVEFIVYEKRNRIFLEIKNRKENTKKKHIFPEDLIQIYDIVAIDDNNILLSANNNGFSDLFSYQIKSRSFRKLTNDIYDDLQPTRLNTKDLSFIFLSNRPDAKSKEETLDSIVPDKELKLYRFRLDSQQKEITIENMALQTEGKLLDYLIDHNQNIVLLYQQAEGNELIYLNDTEYFRLNVSEHSMHIVNSFMKDTFLVVERRDGKKANVELKTLHQFEKISKEKTESSKPLLESSEEYVRDRKDSVKSNLLKFQSKFGQSKNQSQIWKEIYSQEERKETNVYRDITKAPQSTNLILTEFNPVLAIAYRPRYELSNVGFDLNNEILFEGLNTYSGFKPDYDPPRLGILLKGNIKEVFEDYYLEAAIRVPTNFIGSEAFVSFKNLKNRWDHTYSIYRKSDKTIISSSRGNEVKLAINTILFNHITRYAIDHFQSFRLNSTIRNDHQFFLATEKSLLDSSGISYQRLGTRLEYIFDNALDISINIKNGWQLKSFFETSKGFQYSNQTGNSIKALPGLLFITGIDARYHIPVLRRSVFSNRFYWASSFGNERIQYHLGGTENWLLPKYSNEIPISSPKTITYQSLATEVRGHAYGSRKGGSVVSFSSEIRVPILQYILTQTWRNSFLRNLQIVGFYDYGFAWDGFAPNLDKAQTVNIHVENPAVKVDLVYERKAAISGSGVGLRSSIFGYFLRVDYAWKIDKQGWHDPIYHLSLGLDF
ncbi:MAG: outer membrane protein assembly factor [Bacteroidota bacterium]|nr:outer membrane protein assembly factor [Bacteroidota bacterium]